MTRTTIKHLRYFLALADHGHFGRAASASAISQPALSLRIKELEQILGAPLVERGARRIRLTQLGEAVAERARTIVRAVDELEDVARAAQRPFVGRLRLGVIPTVAPYLLPRVISDLARRFPGLDLRPREAITQRLIDDLTDARLDVAIVALPVPEPSLRAVALVREEFVLVRAATEAARPVPSAEALGTMRLLLLEEGHCFRDQALAYCHRSAGTRDLMEGSSLSTLVQMVGVGIGVTLLPEMAVPVETRSAAVSVARLPSPRPSRTIGMVWRRSSPLAARLAELASHLRQVIAPAPGTGDDAEASGPNRRRGGP